MVLWEVKHTNGMESPFSVLILLLLAVIFGDQPTSLKKVHVSNNNKQSGPDSLVTAFLLKEQGSRKLQ